MVWDCSPSWQRIHSNRGHSTPSVRKPRNECRCTIHFPFYSLWDPQPMNDATTFRVGPPCSVKPFWKHCHSHNQNCVSLVILNSVKLKWNINCLNPPWEKYSVFMYTCMKTHVLSACIYPPIPVTLDPNPRSCSQCESV